MTRVYLDVNVVGEAWFRSALSELSGKRKVRFAFSDVKKSGEELARVRSLLDFIKRMSDAGRVDSASPQKVEGHGAVLAACGMWSNKNGCDDPHIFGTVAELPVSAVFSKDHRIAKCRDCIRKSVDKKYCGFIVIGSEAVYNTHRLTLLS